MRFLKMPVAAFLVCLGLSCCARAETITLAYSLENYDLSSYFTQFTEKTGINIEFAQFSTSSMKGEILLRADAQSLPDALIVPGDLLGLDIAKFGVVPDEWLSPELSDNSVVLGKVAGLQKGVPIIAGNHLLLYYNKALVKTPPKNWDELIRYNNGSVGQRVIAWSYNEMYWLIPFFGAYDAYPYEDGKIQFNTQQSREALQFYKQLTDDGYANPGCNYQCAFDAFTKGEVPYTINGSWSLGAFAEKLGEQLGVAMLPKIGNRNMRPYSSVHTLAFPNNGTRSEKREALKKLSQFFQSYDVQQQMWRDINALPVNRSLALDIKRQASENTRNFLTQLEMSEPMPNDPEMAIVWEALVMGFNRYQGGAMTAEEALDYMQHIATKSRDEMR